MLKGWVATFQATSRPVAASERFSAPAIAIRNGTSENRSRLSKTKISTTGALAPGPSADSTSGGPM